ncbi:MAG: LacI family transcriptional regulator [Rhodobacterales bacterium CG2_30_65_12]|nr:MAG: LacI family transcriptional regulator [Rhodobacterales bacterium CG2_30_65_12]
MDEPKIRNMEEFAAVSGISRPTVSKYFNDPGSVRQTTRNRIEQALERYDYRPNIYAMNQNRRLTKNIGIVVPYLADPFFAEIARNIETLVTEAGYRAILMSSHGKPQQEIDNLESLRSIRPAGVLLAPLGRASNRDALAAFCRDVPTVNFDCNVEGLGEAFVGHNNEQATELMVEYLVRTGEPPVFFEMRTPPNPNANKRRIAYVAAMERLGHAPEIVQIEGENWDFEGIGYREGARVISERALQSNTVFCSNDRLAIGFLAAAYELGLRVGRGEGCALRVAGHDNHPYSRYTCPTLTTVSHNYGLIAEKSVNTILSVIAAEDGGGERDMTLLDGELIMRASA